MTTSGDTADVVIIGAGTAGLAAARVLHSSGISTVVLEARDRIGGRLLTRRDPSVPVPIEMGAEFVHGSAEALAGLADEAGLTIYDIQGLRFEAQRGKLRPITDFWTRIDRVMRKLDSVRGGDRSFAEFLAARPGGRTLSRDRALAAQYVAGFHAADLTRISAQALADGGSPRGDVREERIGRLLDGYDRVAEWLASGLTDRVRLGSVVTQVRWRRGGAVLVVERSDGVPAGDIEARAVIVAVPLGVLTASIDDVGAITFSPPLSMKRHALGTLAMGSVTRVAVRVTERFWASEKNAKRLGNEELDRLSFLHGDDEWFPVWWSSYPLRTPLLVAWRGGVKAAELARGGRSFIEAAVVRALARHFRLGKRGAERLIEGMWTHDWEHDPFSRGAYSYSTVGGAKSAAALARPVNNTLFFAGEAAESSGATGTVHGAIATGRRAAREVMRVLNRAAPGSRG